MKQIPLPKFFLLAVAAFSLAAFLFVNLHAGLCNSNTPSNQTLTQPKVENAEEPESYDLPLPDVTVLGRLVDLAQRFIPTAH